MGFDLRTPWQDLPAKVRKAVMGGAPTKVRVQYRNRFGRVRTYDAKFEGVMSFLKRRLDQTESESQKERYQGYMRRCRAMAATAPGSSRKFSP
jgi:excinuclease ABC subunit A